HPYQLDRLGLTKALTAMIRKVSAAAQLDIASSIDNLDGRLSPAAEINLYRIVQEGLNNIVKHAAATEASVQVRCLPPNLQVVIQDNGRGFVRAEVPPSGFGLTGLSERALLLHGTLQIASAPGQGTRITLTMPLSEKEEKS
ncbi:MAG TPA: ATP-binding protein, partial [Blastocatellia bacterium]|nr:ATP-binding protein [Blastocatellia bacterium]